MDRNRCCFQDRPVCTKNHYISCGAHWCFLANAIEPSVCGGDVAFCRMTLTTCYDDDYYYGVITFPKQSKFENRLFSTANHLAMDMIINKQALVFIIHKS